MPDNLGSGATGIVPVDESLITYTHAIYALHALSVLIGITTAATIVGSFVCGIPSIVAVGGRPWHVPGHPLQLADPHVLVRGPVGAHHLVGDVTADGGIGWHSALLRRFCSACDLDHLPGGARLAGIARPSPDVCMKAAILALMICGGMIVAGCGQKGALYLPDKNAAVVTRPGGSSSTTPEQSAPATTPPPLPAPDQGSSQQSPQNGAPEPPPAPTTQGTMPKPKQNKEKKDESQSPPRSQ